MSQLKRLPVSGVQLLPAGTGSLAQGRPPVPAGTLSALGDRGGICVAPTARLTVTFDRNEPDVHVCVGAGDRGVSRQHGLLRHDGQRWMVHNTGHLPIRLSGFQLLLSGHQELLPVAYTPLFIRSGPDREHLLKTRVTGPALTGSFGRAVRGHSPHRDDLGTPGSRTSGAGGARSALPCVTRPIRSRCRGAMSPVRNCPQATRGAGLAV